MLEISIEGGNWLDAVNSSQRTAIEAMLESGLNEEEVGVAWLDQIGPSNSAGYGAGSSIASFFANVKNEFISFICDDGKYVEERAQAQEIWKNQGKVGLVSMVAALVATSAGLAAAAVVPVVALLFSLVSKIGVTSFCKTCGFV